MSSIIMLSFCLIIIVCFSGTDYLKVKLITTESIRKLTKKCCNNFVTRNEVIKKV